MTPAARAVRLILTGGTLDKIHDTASEGLAFPPDGASQVPGLLAEARCHHPAVTELLQMDSLDFTDTERQAILEACAAAAEPALVVTHGTGTMGQTARFLDGRLPGKTVVLTGAMRPFSFGRSDAGFNLGGAIIAAQCLPEGVWGVMNGRVFAAADLEKNVATGRFDA
ncbi:asparaginase domain-containing protein [Mangrovicoccus algicola]|uniref:Asparaginase n=1 Tax=Mangrovicoccus algicola TaxID=2771008 RepID=A0A8J7CWG8_9RHOB|nr:asparaginase domain-containing protein [Mangrovicoccus algicola]MBE3637752.1 asparaginase [Mangrovicoccus algicola]